MGHILKKVIALISLTAVVMSLAATNRCDAQSTPDNPVAIVQRLYRDYAWEVLFGQTPRHWRGLTEESREVLRRYFDDRLTTLILRDHECVVRTRDAACNIEVSPIWISNDPDATLLEVIAMDNPTLVQVSFHRHYPPPNGTKVTLLYQMARTSRGWRIADIIDGDASLVDQLQRK